SLFAIPFGTAPEAVRNGSQENQSKLSSDRSAIARFGPFEDGRAQQPDISGLAPSVQVCNREICGLVLFGTANRLQSDCRGPLSYTWNLCAWPANTINQHLAAVRRLANEAADTGLLSPDLAAGHRSGERRKAIGSTLCGRHPRQSRFL